MQFFFAPQAFPFSQICCYLRCWKWHHLQVHSMARDPAEHCSSWAVLYILQFGLGGSFSPLWFLVVLPLPVSCSWCDVLSATNEGSRVRTVMPLRRNSPQWDQPHGWHEKTESGGTGSCVFKLLSGHLWGEKGLWALINEVYLSTS